MSFKSALNTVSRVEQRITDQLLPKGSPLHIRRKKNYCLELPCSSGGCSFPWLSILLGPNQMCPGTWHCRTLPWLHSKWTWFLDQDEAKDTGSGLGSVVASPRSECALLALFFPFQILWPSRFPSTSSRPIPIFFQGLLCLLCSPVHARATHGGLPGTWMDSWDLNPPYSSP